MMTLGWQCLSGVSAPRSGQVTAVTILSLPSRMLLVPYLLGFNALYFPRSAQFWDCCLTLESQNNITTKS